jgi:hypothetical protein
MPPNDQLVRGGLQQLSRTEHFLDRRDFEHLLASVQHTNHLCAYQQRSNGTCVQFILLTGESVYTRRLTVPLVKQLGVRCWAMFYQENGRACLSRALIISGYYLPPASPARTTARANEMTRDPPGLNTRQRHGSTHLWLVGRGVLP